MAKFMDFFIIGDGEKAIIEVMEMVSCLKAEGLAGHPQARQEVLERLACIDGVYVPALYELPPGQDCVSPVRQGIPARVARQVQPLGAGNQPTGRLVPYISPVQDRLVLEVRRGCDRGCRFCQPGYTYLPVRERGVADLLELSAQALRNSGYEEFSMLSLCVSDYSCLYESVRALNDLHAGNHTNMSFPSQRADRMNYDLAEELKVVRKSGITLAPEAGSERLRRVINKGLSHEQIISAIESAYRSGWSQLKLYYMIGLPGEGDEDLAGIVDTLKEATILCQRIRREVEGERRLKGMEFTCTVSNFVPKPFTPFQWFAQVSPAEFVRKQQFLKEKLRAANLRNVQLNLTDPQISLLEAVIGRGDRRAGELIFEAFKRGARFDAWDEKFRANIWQEAAAALGLDLTAEAGRARQAGSRQSWDIVDVGLNDDWLLSEWQKSLAAELTPPCTENGCHACGVCSRLATEHRLAAPAPQVLTTNPFVKQIEGGQSPRAKREDAPADSATAPDENTDRRIRLEFCKTGDFKFIAHLDLQRLLVRACRRAGLKLAYSEGFSPSPKVSIALALPLFAEGLAELADIELDSPLNASNLISALNRQLPAEVQINRARSIEKNAPSPATLVGRACYRAILIGREGEGEASRIAEKIAGLLACREIMVEQAPSEKAARRAARLGKSEPAKLKNVRPDIFSLAVSSSEPVTVEFCICHGSRAHVKPAVILKLIAPSAAWRITRTEIQTDDGRGLFQTSV
jgi:radical SAM-linked protein